MCVFTYFCLSLLVWGGVHACVVCVIHVCISIGVHMFQHTRGSWKKTFESWFLLLPGVPVIYFWVIKFV